MQQNHKLNHVSVHLVQNLKGKVWLYEVNWQQNVIFFFTGFLNMATVKSDVPVVMAFSWSHCIWASLPGPWNHSPRGKQ